MNINQKNDRFTSRSLMPAFSYNHIHKENHLIDSPENFNDKKNNLQDASMPFNYSISESEELVFLNQTSQDSNNSYKSVTTLLDLQQKPYPKNLLQNKCIKFIDNQSFETSVKNDSKGKKCETIGELSSIFEVSVNYHKDSAEYKNPFYFSPAVTFFIINKKTVEICIAK